MEKFNKYKKRQDGMESFRIGRWEMIGWEFLPADMAVGREC